MGDGKNSNVATFIIIMIIVLAVAFLFSTSNKPGKPSSSMKSTYEKTLQKSKDGVPLTETEKRFIDSYVKSGY